MIDYPKPTTVAQLRRFLGLINSYRQYIPHAAETQASLYAYTYNSKKNDQRVIPWSPEVTFTFEKIKNDLANAGTLAHPSLDAETCLVTDASGYKNSDRLSAIIVRMTES